MAVNIGSVKKELCSKQKQEKKTHIHYALFCVPLGYMYMFIFSCPDIDMCSCVGRIVDCSMHDPHNENGSNIELDSVTLSPATISLDLNSNAKLFHGIHLDQKQLFFVRILNISQCEITNISSSFFQDMRNLVILDISYNHLTELYSHMFRYQNRLTELRMRGNFEIFSIESEAFVGLISLDSLVLSALRIDKLRKNAFSLASFESVDLSSNSIEIIEDQAFEQLEVVYLFLNNSRINSFTKDMFKGLDTVSFLYTDAYVFCCIKPSSLPEENCYPEKDEFSSCADLMRNEALRVMVWLIGLFALAGNILSLIYRFIYEREKMKLGFGIFVTNLAVSDFLMGVYLIIIAGADASLRDVYIFNDESWRSSFWCNLAGILAFLSSESSTFFAALITIDRFIVMKYPFGQVRLTPKKANLLLGAAWAISLFIAVLPFIFTGYFKGVFYSKSSVCLALPLTRDRPPGWLYSIFVFIVLNFVIFVLIAIGQWLIYREVKKSKKSMAGKQAKRKQDSAISRNLLLVVTTNFLCWFPIGVFGKYLNEPQHDKSSKITCAPSKDSDQPSIRPV